MCMFLIGFMESLRLFVSKTLLLFMYSCSCLFVIGLLYMQVNIILNTWYMVLIAGNVAPEIF